MTTPPKTALLNLSEWATSHPKLKPEYSTKLGVALVGKSEEVLRCKAGRALRGEVQLVFSSPPFPLNRKKRYDNKQGDEFKEWLRAYATLLRNLLTPDGSIVIEMGNAWEPERPVMSTLAIETLLEFKRAANLYLCQEFIWFNNARLPTPAQWVNIKRWRVKDAFTRLWWMSPTPTPKADNRNVLAPYSGSMRSLLRTQKYNAGRRPSEHVIGEKSFLKDNGGAIPPNVLTYESEEEQLEGLKEQEQLDLLNNILVGSNTEAADAYHKYCKRHGLDLHPARMPIGLAKFFINLCTDANDLILDPFGGSNTTGAAAEELNRRWMSIEAEAEYLKTGRGRFPALAEADDAALRLTEAAADGRGDTACRSAEERPA